MGSSMDKSPAKVAKTTNMDESVVENADTAPELVAEVTDETHSPAQKNGKLEEDTPSLLNEKVSKPTPASAPNFAVKPPSSEDSRASDNDDEELISYTKASMFANMDKNPNRLSPMGEWPPPIFFDSLNASDQERFYLEHRWHAQWSYYDKKATQAKMLYQRLQLIIGIGSVTVPVLVGLNASNETARNTLQLVTVAISLMVAASAAIESVKTYGDNWRNFRAAAEELHREKSLYDAHAGPYRRAKTRFLLFVERCEDIIAKQNGAWIAFKDEATKDRDDDGDGVPDSQSGGNGNGLKP